MYCHDAGADFDKANDNGYTPPSSAAYWGHTEVVKLLLQAGADPTMTTISGRTPLNVAALFGHEDIVNILNKVG